MPTPAEFILLWVSSLLTLFVFSFLYKDNPFYKFAEYLYVGISAGYYVAFDYQNNLVPNLWIPLVQQGKLEYIIAFVLGILIISRFFPKIAYLSRWSLSFMIGTVTGLAMVVVLQGDLIMQVGRTVLPVAGISEAEGGWWQGFQNLVIIIGVCASLIYFYFSKEQRGFLGGTAKLGIWFLMISFGASFGFTVMARLSLLIGRMDHLINWVQKTIMVLGWG
jgi:hypothetical protein